MNQLDSKDKLDEFEWNIQFVVQLQLCNAYFCKIKNLSIVCGDEINAWCEDIRGFNITTMNAVHGRLSTKYGWVLHNTDIPNNLIKPNMMQDLKSSLGFLIQRFGVVMVDMFTNESSGISELSDIISDFLAFVECRPSIDVIYERLCTILCMSPHPTTTLCSLTFSFMENPVICSDGYAYDRKSIVNWLSQCNVSPMSNREFENRTIIVSAPHNYLIQALIANES